MDSDLRRRGEATLLASWEAYAAAADGAALLRLPGAAVAVFPAGFEREVYNNALLAPGAGVDAVDAVEARYAAAGVTGYAVWVRETDRALRAGLEQRGYRLDSTTLAMGRPLDELLVPAAADDDARAQPAVTSADAPATPPRPGPSAPRPRDAS